MRNFAACAHRCMAAIVEHAESADGVVGCLRPPVRIRIGRDLAQARARDPFDKVEQMHRHIEEHTSLLRLIAPGTARPYRRGALELNDAQRSQRPGAHDFAHTAQDFLEPHLECHAKYDAGVAARSDHLAAVLNVERERFLAQHMLACARRRQCHGVMHRVRRGDENGIDVGIRSQAFNAVIYAWHAERLGECPGFFRRAARAASELAMRRGSDDRSNLFRGKPAEADNAPAYDLRVLFQSGLQEKNGERCARRGDCRARSGYSVGHPRFRSIENNREWDKPISPFSLRGN